MSENFIYMPRVETATTTAHMMSEKTLIVAYCAIVVVASFAVAWYLDRREARQEEEMRQHLAALEEDSNE